MHEQIVGGKTAKLSRLARAGFKVPSGFCLTTWRPVKILRRAVTASHHASCDTSEIDF